MGIYDWGSLDALIQYINQKNDQDSKILSDALWGDANIKRSAQYTNQQTTGRNDRAIAAIQKAMQLDSTDNLGTQLKQVGQIFSSMGIDLQARVEKVGGGLNLKIIPSPAGDPNFYTSGEGSKLNIKPVEWSIPVDKDGRIIYDGLEKANMLHAISDDQGNVKLLGAAEVAIRKVLEQLSYQKNLDVIKHLNGGTDQQMKEAARRLNYILNDMTRKAVSPASNTSASSASVLSEIQQMFKINGTPYRQDVATSGVFLGNAFDQLFKKHLAGKGSFATQEIKRDQLNNLVGEMGLLVRSLGAAKGFEVIKRNAKFAPIMNSATLSLPILKALSTIASWDTISGPVTDTHGLDITYLNGVQRAFGSLIPKSSRKGAQTELIDQEFFNQIRAGHSHQGALFITEFEKQNRTNAQLDSKAYDTTRLLQLDAQQWDKAVNTYRQSLKDRHERVVDDLDTAQTELISLQNQQKDITDVQDRIDRLSRKKYNIELEQADLQKNILYGIQNGGLILSHSTAQRLASRHIDTHKLRNSDIYTIYEDLLNNKKAGGVKITDDVKRATAKKAVSEAMHRTYRDLEKYNPSADIIFHSGGSGKYTMGKELDSFVDDFLQNPDNYKGQTNSDTVFGVLQGGKNPNSLRKDMKYVTPGAIFRMMGGGMSDSVFNRLKPFIAKTLGVSFSSIQDIEGVVERANLDNKNLVNYVSGVFNDAAKRSIGSTIGPKDYRLKTFKDQVIANLPQELVPVVEAMMQIKDGRYVQTSDRKTLAQFKQFAPAILQAVAIAEDIDVSSPSKWKNEWRNKTVKTTYVQDDIMKEITGLTPTDIYNILAKRTDDVLLDKVNRQLGAGSAVTIDDLFSNMRFNDTSRPLSLIVAQHHKKKFGMPLSKGGTPVEYGYREFNALKSLIDYTASTQDTYLGTYRDVVESLAHQTDISKPKYQGMLDYYNLGQTLSRFSNRTTPEQIAENKGIILDITKDFNDPTLDAFIDIYTDRDKTTNLAREDKLRQSLLTVIRRKQEEKFTSLTANEQRELIRQAGGDSEVERTIADLRKLPEWDKARWSKGKAALIKARAKVGQDAYEEALRTAAETQIGAKKIPWFVFNPNVKAYDGGDGNIFGQYIAGPEFSWDRRLSPVSNDMLIDIGGGSALSFIQSFYRATHEGQNPETIAQNLGPKIFRTYEQTYSELTDKDKSIYDRSIKTPLGHSFMGTVADLTLDELEEKYRPAAAGSIFTTEQVVRQMLAPNKDEQEAMSKGVYQHSTWLAAQYAGILNKNTADIINDYNDEFEDALNEDIKKAQIKIDNENLQPHLDTQVHEAILRTYQGQVDRANRLIAYKQQGTPLDEQDTKYLESRFQNFLIDKIVDRITFGSDSFTGRGLAAIFNRYPSITGTNDVQNANLFINPAWTGRKSQLGSLWGGDPRLNNVLNADYDGDTIATVLFGANINQFDDYLKKHKITPKDTVERTKMYGEWLDKLGAEQRKVILTTTKMAKFDDRLARIAGVKPEAGVAGEALAEDEDLAGQDVFLTKTGKAFTGMFSNIRQSFMNVFRNNANSYSSASDSNLSLSTDMLGNFLSIFEQSGISAKKLTSSEHSRWERKLSAVYELVNNPDLWDQGQEGIARIIEMSQSVGILGDDNNLLDLTDMTKRRLFSPFLLKAIEQAQINSKDDEYLRGFSRMFGLGDTDADLKEVRKFLSKVSFTPEGDLVEDKDVDAFLGKTKLTKSGLMAITDTVAKAAARNTFQTVGASGNPITIKSMGDFVRNKSKILSASQKYKALDFGIDVSKLKDEDLDTLKEVGVIVDTLSEEVSLTNDFVADRMLEQNLQEISNKTKQLGEKFFDSEVALKEFNEVYTDLNANEKLIDKVYKKTPTRVLGKILPYKFKNAQYDYQKQFDIVKKNLGIATDATQIFESGDERQGFLKQFESIEGGHLAHEVAQGMLELLTDEKEFARIKDIVLENGKFTTPTGDMVDLIGTQISNEAKEHIFNRAENTTIEDTGGISVQTDRVKSILNLFKPHGETTGETDSFINDLYSSGLGMALVYLKNLGVVDAQNNLDEAKLKSLGIQSETALMGTLGGKKLYGRMDVNALTVSKGNTLYPTDILSKAQEVVALLGANNPELDLEKISTIDSIIDVIDQAQTNKWSGYTDNEERLQQIREELNPRLDQELFTWNIGDFKTALHSGDPYLSNVIQVLMYGQEAENLRQQVNKSRAFNMGYKDFIENQKKAYKGRFSDLQTAVMMSQTGDDFDSAFESFYEQFKTADDTKNVYQALYSNNNENEEAVKTLIKKAAWSDRIGLNLIKSPRFSELVESWDISYDQLSRNPYAQSMIGWAMINPDKDIFGAESPFSELEFKNAIWGSVKKSGKIAHVDKELNQFDNTAEYNTAISKAGDFIRKYRTKLRLEEKEKEGTITDKEAATLEKLNNIEDYEGLGTKGSMFGAFLSGLEGLTPEQQANLFTALGLENEYQYLAPGGELIDTASQNVQNVILGALGKSATQEETKYKRAKGIGLQKWLKAKEDNDKYQTQIDDLLIKQKGYQTDSTEYAAIDSKIKALKDLQYLNNKTIEEQEAIHGDQLKDENSSEVQEINNQIRELKKNQNRTKPGTKKYESYQKQIDELENKKYIQRETSSFKDIRTRYEAEQQLAKKMTTQEKVEGLQEKYGQRAQLLQREADINEMLKSGNLTTEERFMLNAELNKIQDTLNTVINNYIDAWTAEIEKEGTDKQKEMAKGAKEALDKPASQVIAAYNSQIGTLAAKETEGSKAFQIYNGMYGAQLAYAKNTEALSGLTLNPTQKRLLELEQLELKDKWDLAKLERAKYEEESKTNPKLVEINKHQEEKARLLYEQSVANVQKRPGVLNSVEGKIGATISSLAKGYGLHRVLSRLIQTITKLISQAISLDKVLANLRIVTGDSKNNTRALISEYAALGKAIGATTTEVASSAVEWLRQGYETAEVLDLVKSSMYLSKLGMMDASTATQSLTSALKGFKLQASESMDVVDKLTAIDMKAATSAGEIAQGLAQFANLGSLAGVNIDQAAAYVATISDVTQMSGSSAGQALKTIISRYGNVKAGAYSKLNTESESSDENMNLNDVERVLSKIGISIRKSNLEFKDFDEVLDSVAEKWDSLDTVSKKAVATAFAGIRQQEAFTTLLQNWDKYQNLLEVSERSKGTAEKKYVSYKESFEAAKGSFTAALENFMNRSEVNDLLTKIVKLATKLVDNLPKLIKIISQVFFAIQTARSFTGDSLISKGLKSFMGSNFIKGFDFSGLKPQNLGAGAKMTFGETVRMLAQGTGRGLRGAWTGIMGRKDKKTIAQKIREKFLGIPTTTGQTTPIATEVTTTTGATTGLTSASPTASIATTATSKPSMAKTPKLSRFAARRIPVGALVPAATFSNAQLTQIGEIKKGISTNIYTGALKSLPMSRVAIPTQQPLPTPIPARIGGEPIQRIPLDKAVNIAWGKMSKEAKAHIPINTFSENTAYFAAAHYGGENTNSTIIADPKTESKVLTYFKNDVSRSPAWGPTNLNGATRGLLVGMPTEKVMAVDPLTGQPIVPSRIIRTDITEGPGYTYSNPSTTTSEQVLYKPLQQSSVAPAPPSIKDTQFKNVHLKNIPSEYANELMNRTGPYDKILQQRAGTLNKEAVEAWKNNDYSKALSEAGVTKADIRAYNKDVRTNYKQELKQWKTKKAKFGKQNAGAKPTLKGKLAKTGGGSGAAAGVASGLVAGLSFAGTQIMSGLTAYELIGQTHKNAKGEDVQSSDTARKAGGKTAAVYSTLVPIIGQYIGEKEAQKVMASIDGVRDAMNTMSKQATAVVAAIKSVDGSIETLSEISESGSFDYEKMQEAISNISKTMYSSDNAEARQELQKHLDGRSVSDILHTYENGSEKERKQAARQLKLASLETQRENNEKIREAELYNQTRNEVSAQQYLEWQKAKNNNDYGFTDAEMRDMRDARRYAGTEAAVGAGAGLIAAGGVIAGATGVETMGIGALVGGLIAAGGAIATGAAAAIHAKEETAAIAEIQQQKFEEFKKLDIFEQESRLLERERELQKELNSRGQDASINKELDKVTTLLSQIQDTTGVIKEQIKQRNDERIQEAMVKAYDWKSGKYLDEMSLTELKNLGVSEIIELVASQMSESDYSGGYLKDKDTGKLTHGAEKAILRNLKSDDLFSEVISGGIFTLSEALERAEQFEDDKYEQKRLQSFATAIGVNVRDLKSVEDTYGSLKLSELLFSTAQNLESIEEYSSLLSDIADGSKSATKWMSEIVSKYPELIAYMSDTSTLISKVMEKMKALMDFEFSSQWNELSKDQIFYKDLLTKTSEETGYSTIKSGIANIDDEVLRRKVQAFLDASRAKDFSSLLDIVIGNGYNTDKATEEVKALGDILMAVGDNYKLVSDAYQEQLSNYIDYNSKVLESQINNLTQQKEALQQITQQREYENKLIEAKLKLEEAVNNKQRVYRAGVGFVYEADQNAIAQAEDELENVTVDKEVSMLQAQTDILQALKDRWDTMYDKKSFELQEEQAHKFEEYILNSTEGGFKENMSSLSGDMGVLSTSMSLTEGVVRSLYEETQAQVKAKATYQQEVLDELSAAYIDYALTGNNERLLDYNDLYKEAQDAGISNRVMDAAIAEKIQDEVKQKEASKRSPSSARTELGESIIRSQNKAIDSDIQKLQSIDVRSSANLAESLHKDAEKQEQVITTKDLKVYKFDDEWYREVDSSNKLATAKWVMYDAIRKNNGNMPSTVAASTVGFSGQYGEFIGADGKVTNTWDLLFPGRTHGGAQADKMYTDLSNKIQEDGGIKYVDDFAKQVSAAMKQTTLVRGTHGDGPPELMLIKNNGEWVAVEPLEKSYIQYIDSPNSEEANAKIPLKTNQYQYGTLSTLNNSASLINEIGTEAIITPSGTITALPSHTGVVPADITKNLWALGEIAPTILRLITPSLSPDKIGNSSQDSIVDESFNISTLNMNVTADKSFDADAFVDSIKNRANLTKNIHR